MTVQSSSRSGLIQQPDPIKDAVTTFTDSKYTFELIDKDMSALLKELRKTYRVVIISAYPHTRARIKNLEMYDISLGVQYDEIWCVGRKNKIKDITSFNPKFVIEDCPDHIEELVERGCTLFVPGVWNYLVETLKKFSHLNNVNVYKDVKDLKDLIKRTCSL